MKFDQTLMLSVKKILETNHVPMLLGEPGIGKSSWVEDLGQLMHTQVFVLACNQLSDKADLTGARLAPVGKTLVTNQDGTQTEEIDYAQVFFPHIVIKQAIDYAKENPNETPILFMDELNRTTPDVTSEALSLPTLRSIGNKKLPPNLRIITAGNDKGNITALDEASRTRFVLLHVDPDVETFLAVNPELNPFVRSVISAHPDTIFGRTMPAILQGAVQKKDDDDDDANYNIEDILDEGEEMFQLTTPRTITSVSDWLNTCTNDELKMFIATATVSADGEQTTMLQEILEAHTGQTAFTTLLLQEIVSKVNTVNSQANIFSVPKPNCYDMLKAQPTRDSMTDYIDQMSDNDKSGCLVYAMSQRGVDTDIIQALTKGTAILQPNDVNNFAKLFSSDGIPEANKQVFFDCGTQLATQWKGIFG